MLKLTDYMKKRVDVEQRQNDMANNVNKESPIFTFPPLKKGDVITFKLMILPSITNGKINIDDAYFIENRQHKVFIRKIQQKMN